MKNNFDLPECERDKVQMNLISSDNERQKKQKKKSIIQWHKTSSHIIFTLVY